MLVSVLNNSAVCTNTTPDEVSNHVNRHIGRHRLELMETETSRAQLSLCQFSDLSLSRICYGNRVRVACPDLEDIYHFQIVMRGECQWRFSDTDMLLTSGQALMMNPGEKIDLVYSDDCEKLIVKIPREVMNNTCIELAGRVPNNGILFERKVRDIRQSQSFLSCIEAVFYEASEESELSLNGISASYRDLLVQKLMSTFNSNLMDVMPPTTPEDKKIQRVLVYIDANIKENLTVEELSAIAGISVRKLYSLFANSLSTTPKRYIKQAKLLAIHRELQKNPAIRNVTEAAMDYAVTHLGRFSSEYRETFGELPSATLKARNL
ncbi:MULTISPECIES: AraC family transcriptional regulator [unclassified Oceanobacter]|jgi:AraC-like DNA-binding protein|uniref:AraC family transcriptional regulator n=1 Tax=unclassified Oceanobacter TaxID=2620260 RepID=UPI0026E1FA1F|nr:MULTISPECIES: AraC family transcriptional regulator [unclassified Oceanobacter]MDO6683715.1 AraC family transcriptional regulator [Oceanobacter sp. 5_MG-2023]MDP2549327.1 AraC family transcriptional regulator [Oceanobacter sp. 4_MG-2023]MDP2609941.1 AraC family transcriptional regulator [Oceanobacter sp. 1_MG-2023]MDP2613177.1 AraC family transcriptional regulator [Oceanobacter sp. 2_MG-2023]